MCKGEEGEEGWGVGDSSFTLQDVSHMEDFSDNGGVQCFFSWKNLEGRHRGGLIHSGSGKKSSNWDEMFRPPPRPKEKKKKKIDVT